MLQKTVLDWKAQTPLILLAEPHSSAEGDLRSVLASQGWLIKAVESSDMALRAASEFAPQLVLVDADLEGAAALVRTFCRDHGGPGVVVIGDDVSTGSDEAAQPLEDARLPRPVDHVRLIESVRMGLAATSLRRPPKAEEEAAQIWSSEEIFGDLIADLDAEDEQQVIEEAAAADPAPSILEPEPPTPAPPVLETQPLPIEPEPPTLELEDEEAEAFGTTTQVDAGGVSPSLPPADESPAETAQPTGGTEDTDITGGSATLDESENLDKTATDAVASAPASAPKQRTDAVPSVVPPRSTPGEAPRRTAAGAPPQASAPSLTVSMEQTLAGISEEALRSGSQRQPPTDRGAAEREIEDLLGGLVSKPDKKPVSVPRGPAVDPLAGLLESLQPIERTPVPPPAAQVTSDAAARDLDSAEIDLPNVEILAVEAAVDFEKDTVDAPPEPDIEEVEAKVVTTAPLSSAAEDRDDDLIPIEEDEVEPVLHLLDDESTDAIADLAGFVVEDTSPSSRGTTATGDAPPTAEETAEVGNLAPEIDLEAVLEVEDAPVEEAEPPVVEEDFGDYALEERIGIGGMAEVWRARRKGVEGFEKRVAIKRILPQPASNPEFVEMFIDEAKLAAELNHNHITHIYELGKLGESYFIAMEYVDGKDLRTILNLGRGQDKPLPGGLALYVAACLASALEYAHKKRDPDGRNMGLVHRDISPQNVLISGEGDIKLCDFGIAKAVSKVSTTQMGALKGKLQFMSPEQAWGRQVDSRSDLFSLGSILFEMISGSSLFAGESEIAVLESVRNCDIEARLDQTPGVSSPVRALLLRTLAADPDQRYSTAEALRLDLETIISSLKPRPAREELAHYVQGLLGRETAAGEVDHPTGTTEDKATDSEAASPKPPAAGASPLLEKTRPVDTAQHLDPDERLRQAAGELDAQEGLITEELADDEGPPRRSKRWILWLLAILLAAAVGTFFVIQQVNAGGSAVPTAGLSESTGESTGTTPSVSPPETVTAAGNVLDDASDSQSPLVGADGAASSTPPPATGDPVLDRQFREELQRVEELLEASPLSDAPTEDSDIGVDSTLEDGAAIEDSAALDNYVTLED